MDVERRDENRPSAPKGDDRSIRGVLGFERGGARIADVKIR
jgi:hypothetical protein